MIILNYKLELSNYFIPQKTREGSVSLIISDAFGLID